MHQEAKEFLDFYNDGLFTKQEIVPKFIELAVDVCPSEYMMELPEDIVSDIRRIASKPPKVLGSIFFIESAVYKREISQREIELGRENSNLRFFGGCWRLKVFFNEV